MLGLFNESSFKFFTKLKLSSDFKLLCLYHTIVSLANGMIGLFLPIFLLKEFNNSINWVIIFYTVGFALYGLFVPFGAMLMSKIGLRKSMIFGRIWLVFFFVCLYFFHNNPLLFSVLSNIALLFFRLLYWTPYHVSFVQFTDGKYRGRQMAWLAILGYMISIGAPLLAGIILYQFSFNFLFVLTIIIILVAIIPLSGLTDVRANFEFSFKKTWKEFLKKKNKSWRTAYAADGAQSMVGVVIWPIFIYQLLNEEYLAIGAIIALIVIITIVFQMLVGGYTDKFPKRKMIKLGSTIYSVGWIAKAFAGTAFQIFVAGTFHNFALIMLRTPFDAFFYDLLDDRGSYVDEYAVIRSISLNIGRVLMAIVLLILISFFGLQVAFFVAAIVSLFVNLL